MVLAALAEQFEQLVKQEGRGDHGGAGIMAKTAALEHLGAPADGMQPVDKGYRIAAGAHPERRGDAAKPGTDDENVTGYVG